MGKKPKYTDFAKVCKTNSGIIAGIANTFKVERQTVYNWCEKDARFQQCIDDARETFLDVAETNLQVLVKGIPKREKNEQGQDVFAGWEVPPSESAIVFALRTLGRKRGYSERNELDVTTKGKEMNGGGIPIELWITEKMRKK